MSWAFGPSHPTAQHKDGPVQATEFKLSWSCPVAGVPTTLHVDPFQCSTSDDVSLPLASVLVPVAQHDVAVEHEMPRKYPSSAPICTNVHLDPFQCSAKGSGAPECGRPPTAQQLSGSTQLTPVKIQLSSAGGSVGTVVHLEPFQCCMTPANWLPPSSNCPPTDQQSHASAQVEPRNKVCGGEESGTIDQPGVERRGKSIAEDALGAAPAAPAGVARASARPRPRVSLRSGESRW